MDNMARNVADLIWAESQSGSGSWDELHGPDSEYHRLPDGSYRVILPEGWDDSGEDQPDPDNSKRWCVITVTMADTKPSE